MIETIEIYGRKIRLPERTEVYANAKSRKDQFFVRTEIPDSFGSLEFDTEGIPIYSDSQADFVTKEYKKIRHGYWFYNNGTATYITGLHYFYLNYWTLEDGNRPDYRDADRRWFIFRESCEKDPRCFGVIRIKKRREGATSQEACALVYKAIMQPKSNCGIVSKTGNPDARDVFQKMVVWGYKNLPVFLKPSVEDETSKTSLIFSPPKRKNKTSTRTKGQVFDDDMGLESVIDYRATALNSYDSGRLTSLLADECFAGGTKILCEGFIFRNIEDIKIGDKVIVEGGKLVEVADVCQGQDEMYLIHQPYSKDYIVNSKHRLYLEQRCRTKSVKDDGIKIITPVDYLGLGKYKKRTTYGVRSSGINFEHKEVEIDPYVLGTWLGDGFTGDNRWIVNKVDDIEIYDYLKSFAENNGYRFRERDVKGVAKSTIISISNSNNRWKKDSLTQSLINLGIYKCKRIPSLYMQNSRDVRMELLAGIIDTDGYNTKHGSYSIAMSRKELIEDISTIAKSLGFSVSKISEKTTNYKTKAYLISISGDIQNIPVKVERKKLIGYKKSFEYRRNRIEVSSIGIGNYYGITLKADNDNDRRLILEDFTISMNCGKWPKDVPVNKYWAIVKKTLTRGMIKVGFAVMPSTVNDAENGGMEFRELFEGSNHFENEVTATGMYQYFTPAYDGYEGFIDKYGMSIIEAPTKEQKDYIKDKFGMDINVGAKEFLLSQRQLIKDQTALSEEIRMNPFTVEEAFKIDAKKCYFNSEKIYEQLNFISENPVRMRKGDFYWKDSNKGGEVYFQDSPSGCWNILELPQVANNSVVGERGRLPANTALYTIGVDPFRNSMTNSKYASMGSAWVLKKYNTTDPENTGMPVAHYYGRPKLKSMFDEEMLKAASYYGCKLVYELDAGDDVMRVAMELKMVGYMSKTPDSAIKPGREGQKQKEWGVKSSDPFAMSQQLELAIQFVEHHSHKIFYQELLEEMLIYDHMNRTPFDKTVSFMIGLLGMAEHRSHTVNTSKAIPIQKFKLNL